MVYTPVIEYNGSRERMNGKMYAADSWLETQVCGATVMAPKAFVNMLNTTIGYVAGRCDSSACHLCTRLDPVDQLQW